jgi:hypothetical protein
MGLPTYVVQIDIRRAFPSAGREAVLASMRARGLGGAWLGAFWRLQATAGVRLSTSGGGYSRPVDVAIGLLEGRVLSGDGFAFLLDGLRVVLEASGLGVRLAVRGGEPLWVGAIMKTDDVLLLGNTENEVRLAYGVVLAWCNEMRFEHAPEKTRLMLTGPAGVERARLKTVAVWSWAPNELVPLFALNSRMGAFVPPQVETLLYRPHLKYLGDYFDCMMAPDFALRQRFGVAEGILASMQSAVLLVSSLKRAHLLQTLHCHLRSALEQPHGVMGGLSVTVSEKAEAIYLRALRLIFGTGVATYYPSEVVRELMGASSLMGRRHVACLGFSRKLAAITNGGPRAVAFACFRACTAAAFVKVSVTHEMGRAASALGVALPHGNESKAAWKSVLRAALAVFERTRRHVAIAGFSTARRLWLVLQHDAVLGYAPLTCEWRQDFVMSQQACGGTMALLVVLCEKYRLFPATRSKFIPGGPTVGFCDLCFTQLGGPANAAHFFLECSMTGVDIIRTAWQLEAHAIMASHGASFTAGADPLLASIGLSPIIIASTHVPNVTHKIVSSLLTRCFVSHWGDWFVRESHHLNRLAPTRA